MLLKESPGEVSDGRLACLNMGDDELVEKPVVEPPLLTLSKEGNIDSIPSPFSIPHSEDGCLLSFSGFEGLDMRK